MRFQTICEFVSEARRIKVRGGRGSKKESENWVAKKLGTHLLAGDIEANEVESCLATLFPYKNPNGYAPLGLTTMMYIIQAAVNEKFSGTRKHCPKGENPFDTISVSCVDMICSDKDQGVDTFTIQRGINMMCVATGRAKHHTLLHILSQCNVLQSRMFCEILACSMTFGMGFKRFLESLDSEKSDSVDAAMTTFVMTNDLGKVSEALFSGFPHQMEVGYYVSSMLSRQKAFHCPSEAFDFIKFNSNAEIAPGKKRKKVLKTDDELTKQTHFIAQLKIDGYRIQLHRSNGSDGSNGIQRTWYFSRNGLNLAESYHFNVLDEEIEESMCGTREFILDGEIIAVDKDTGEYMSCSDMASYPWMHSENIILIYYVFDILYSDGEEHINRPYEERLHLLENLMTRKTRVIPMVYDSTHIIRDKCIPLCFKSDDKDCIVRYYKTITESFDLEGIMLKDGSSVWKPYERTNNQIKVKPLPIPFDLFIVGANVNRMQLVSSVLLAYKKEEGHYYTMTMCGTGLTACARQTLTEWFFERNRKSTRGGHHVPSYLHTVGGSDKPHMYLCDDPMECRIVAQKMTNSKVYAQGKTLRFPVIKSIPCIKYDSEVKRNTWKTELEEALPVQVGFVQKCSTILQGDAIWIAPTKDDSVYSELLRHVLRMDGVFHKDPMESTTVFVVPDSHVDRPTLDLAKKEYPHVSIVHADWLRNCFLWNRRSDLSEFLGENVGRERV